MSFTKEQQKQVEEYLKRMLCHARFELDGHTIDVFRRRKSERETVLFVYIDEEVKGVNLGEIGEKTEGIAKRVYRQRSTSLYKAKQIKEIEKVWGKRRAKKEFPRLHEKLVYLDCCFSSASSLVRQFAKLEGIKLVKIRGEQA